MQTAGLIGHVTIHSMHESHTKARGKWRKDAGALHWSSPRINMLKAEVGRRLHKLDFCDLITPGRTLIISDWIISSRNIGEHWRKLWVTCCDIDVNSLQCTPGSIMEHWFSSVFVQPQQVIHFETGLFPSLHCVYVTVCLELLSYL